LILLTIQSPQQSDVLRYGDALVLQGKVKGAEQGQRCWWSLPGAAWSDSSPVDAEGGCALERSVDFVGWETLRLELGDAMGPTYSASTTVEVQGAVAPALFLVVPEEVETGSDVELELIVVDDGDLSALQILVEDDQMGRVDLDVVEQADGRVILRGELSGLTEGAHQLTALVVDDLGLSTLLTAEVVGVGDWPNRPPVLELVGCSADPEGEVILPSDWWVADEGEVVGVEYLVADPDVAQEESETDIFLMDWSWEMVAVGAGEEPTLCWEETVGGDWPEEESAFRELSSRCSTAVPHDGEVQRCEFEAPNRSTAWPMECWGYFEDTADAFVLYHITARANDLAGGWSEVEELWLRVRMSPDM
jgi:hypothetical protein